MSEEENQAHATYGPSSLAYYELCPSYESSQGGDTTASDEGTLLHEACETDDLELCENDEQRDAVQWCIDRREAATQKLLSECGDAKPEEYRELRVDCAGLTWGTGDQCVIAGTRGLLGDYKFGRVAVPDVPDNIQMQAYTLGMFTMFPQLTQVDVYIWCPRMGNYESTGVYYRKDVKTITERIKKILERVRADEKEENPSEKACRYCGRKAECKALTEVALTVGQKLGLPLPSVFDAGRMVSGEDRSDAQALSYILEDWGKQVRKANMEATLEDGIDIPNFSIVSRAATPKITEVANAIAAVMDLFGVDPTLIHQACSISVGKLVTIVHSTRPDEPKNDIKEAVLCALDDFITRGEEVQYLQRKRGTTNEDIIQQNRNARLGE